VNASTYGDKQQLEKYSGEGAQLDS